MNVLYLDCPSGISGNMALGALIELGVSAAEIEHAFAAIGHTELHLVLNKRDTGNAIFATHVTVMAGDRLADPADTPHEHEHHHHHEHDEHEHHHHGHEHDDHEHHHTSYKNIREMLETSSLVEPVKTRALGMFARIARAESRIHNTDLDDVHFHEVGALDSIGDVVGVAAAMHALEVDQIVVSSLPMGQGTVETRHGTLPLPAPATQLILEGALTHGSSLNFEFVTPTGAAIVTEYATAWGVAPSMTVLRTGHGAGTKRVPGRANVLRAVLGTQTGSPAAMTTLTLLEANIDDMNPEHVDSLCQHLFEDALARDVWWTSITMKRGRPAFTISALVDPELADSARAVFFRHSTSLGVRQRLVERYELDRTTRDVETLYGAVTVKLGLEQGRILNIAPEHRSVASAASAHNATLREVYAATLVAASNSGLVMGSDLANSPPNPEIYGNL